MTNPNFVSPGVTTERTIDPHTNAVEPRVARERELMQRILNGEADLFYELIKPYERAVFLAAVSIVGNDADAEEVAQEAALKGFKYLSQFRQEAKFSTWLIQITINEAKMKLRKDRRHLYESLESTRENDDGEYVPTDFADWREIPSEVLEKHGKCATSWRSSAATPWRADR